MPTLKKSRGYAEGKIKGGEDNPEYARHQLQISEQSALKAEEAEGHKNTAKNNAILSKKYADGKDLENVADPTFAENNSKYYAEQSEQPPSVFRGGSQPHPNPRHTVRRESLYS